MEETDVRPLREHCRGDVVVPGERDWLEALADSGLDDGRQPAAVVYPESDYDLIAVLSFVRCAGLSAVLYGTDAAAGDVRGTVVVHPA